MLQKVVVECRIEAYPGKSYPQMPFLIYPIQTFYNVNIPDEIGLYLFIQLKYQ